MKRLLFLLPLAVVVVAVVALAGERKDVRQPAPGITEYSIEGVEYVEFETRDKVNGETPKIVTRSMRVDTYRALMRVVHKELEEDSL